MYKRTKRTSNFSGAFSLIEILFVLLLLSLLSAFFLKPTSTQPLQQASQQLLFYLEQTRMQAMLENHYDSSNDKWHKKRWTLKFFRCVKSVGGLYYVIYSDRNQKGHPNLNESLKDSLSNKHIYSTNRCEQKANTVSNVLLTQEFGITKVEMSCNETSSLGQLSFGNDGKVYAKLGDTPSSYEIKEPCIIKLYDKNQAFTSITIENRTGYVSIKEQNPIK